MQFALMDTGNSEYISRSGEIPFGMRTHAEPVAIETAARTLRSST